jgi:hypothetical protein
MYLVIFDSVVTQASKQASKQAMKKDFADCPGAIKI